ncbi:MAG: ATPase P, partial [Eubacteriales bacterium]
DRFLQEISCSHPEIPVLSREGEKKLAEARAKEEARYVKNLTPEAEASIAELLRAKEILSENGEMSTRLSYSAKQKRTIDLINPTYRYAALAIFLLAAAACVFGVISVFQHKGYSAYFILFGVAFMLFAMSTRVMPTGKNNRRAAQREWDKALYDMQGFVSEHKEIPVPAQYAHPATLDRMIRVIREGKAESVGKAYEVMKEELRAINNQVTVSQTEYDEIVAIKPMFLLCGYRDDLAETV